MSTEVSGEVVTLLVRHCVSGERADEYERWLRTTVGVAKSFPGHLGVDVMRQRDGDRHRFVSVLRFADAEHLQGWLSSSERRRLIEEVAPLLIDGDRTEANAEREFWFTPGEAERQPPRWKQACVTFLVILPLTLIVPQLWRPLFNWSPWTGGYVQSNVLITLTIVLLVVYWLMPMVTRWCSSWLNAR